MAAKTTTHKKLYRSESDRVIAGVCGGLGEYFDIDPVLIRVILVIITLLGGWGLILYLILWIVIPREKSLKKSRDDSIHENIEEIKERAHSVTKNDAKFFAGLLVILFGLGFLFSNFGIFSFLQIGRLWPLILIALGVIIIARNDR